MLAKSHKHMLMSRVLRMRRQSARMLCRRIGGMQGAVQSHLQQWAQLAAAASGAAHAERAQQVRQAMPARSAAEQRRHCSVLRSVLKGVLQ